MRRLAPIAGIALGIVVGCDQPTGSSGPKNRTRNVPVVEAPPEPPPAPEAPRVPILGQRTREIGQAEAEKRAGGVVATQKITARDPITLQGNAYVTSIGKLAIGQIDQALNLYQAANGEYPRTYEEFMEGVIRANNIALPKLPAYQKYAYDAPTHKLLVIEYPDLK
ncbi:hypothetical protein P12x_000059 [Tundrisphaera lichenicola]|uniref:hypothetical protein n=1 Tax=Tundrisphaera lichenicola TaxID=2029860 RepID=UPI003EBBD838